MSTSIYDPVTKTLQISPIVGVRRIIMHTVPTNTVWIPGTVIMSDMSKTKRYACQFAISNKVDIPLWIRPMEPYHDNLFESLFDFSSHCVDFSDKRIIGIVAGENFCIQSSSPEVYNTDK